MRAVAYDNYAEFAVTYADTLVKKLKNEFQKVLLTMRMKNGEIVSNKLKIVWQQ